MATTQIDPTQQNQAEADAAGISLADYQALLAKYPPVYNANTQGGQYGMSAGGSYGQNPQLAQILQTLQLTKQQQQQAAAGNTAGAAPSYLSPPGGSGSGNMTWQDIMNTGYGASDIAAFQQHGWSPAQVMDSIQKGYAQPPSSGPAAASAQNAFGITSQDSGKGYTTLTNAKTGQTVNVDASGNYFTTDANGNNTPVSDTQAQSMGFQSQNPETQALKQMGQIDPASETLRTAVSQSYLTPLQQAAQGGPTSSQLKSYLDTYQQTDPTGYASIGALNQSEDASLKQATDQLALGSQLDPVTARQVEQQTRAAQAARGNVYGTPQMAEEAMTTGQAGLALQQQRQAAAQAAQGNMQSYLSSGDTYGGTALGLYQQNLSNLQNAQTGALNYLGSGQTPYQTGASYLNQANQNAAAAAQGGPVYQPAALGSTTQASQIPQYGLDIGQQSQNWYNSLSAYSNQGGGATKNKGAAAATGALSGAASGAAAGTMAYPGIGTAIGAGVGALAGGASGYFS